MTAEKVIDNKVIILRQNAGYSLEPVVVLWYNKKIPKERRKLWQINADRKVMALSEKEVTDGGKPESLSDTRTMAHPCINRHSQRHRKAR